jgi:hypothetical protein
MTIIKGVFIMYIKTMENAYSLAGKNAIITGAARA